jgi:hypothetical protein
MSMREDENEAFFQAIERVSQYWPALESTLDRAFYSGLTLPDNNGLIMAGLGKQCAETLGEIHFVCRNGYGLAGTKLLRGLYERTVAAAFFAKNPEAARRFLDSFDLDFGKLMHRHQEFAKANGQELITRSCGGAGSNGWAFPTAGWRTAQLCGPPNG